MTEPDRFSVPRSQWVRCLSTLRPEVLKALAASCTAGCEVLDLQLPKAGLGLLQLRDSALGDAYFIGEIPLAKAHVRITTESGRVVEGAAFLMDDRIGLVKALATLDAVLTAKIPGWEQVEAALLQGHQTVLEQVRVRKLIIETTRVDFSLLSAAREDDDV